MTKHLEDLLVLMLIGSLRKQGRKMGSGLMSEAREEGFRRAGMVASMHAILGDDDMERVMIRVDEEG